MSSRGLRLDQVLVERKLAPSRSRAKALIMAGHVRVAGQVVSKPGIVVGDGDVVEVESLPIFVSRGGDKLLAALDASGVPVTDRSCVDIGSSTGGFTDCLLQRGAAHILAIDVGYGQLAYRLRKDSRVRVMERVNARYLTADAVPEDIAPPTLMVMDVAFIGVTKVLPAVSSAFAAVTDALILVKPQFECSPRQVGSGGIVTSAATRRQALDAVAQSAYDEGWQLVAAIPSPIRGQAGNWECFLQLRRPAAGVDLATATAVLDSVEVPDDTEA